jgi:putative NADH-flavin reductase
MNVAVFGGTGAIGRLVIGKALERGYDVVAYSRDASRLPTAHERLHVVIGELDDTDAISSAIQGSDVVVSVLGPGAKEPGLIIATGTLNIVAAMQAHRVRRLVAIATPSYRDPRDGFDPLIWLAVFAIRVFLPVAYRNVVRLAEVVVASGLDWTLVRIPLLSNRPSTGSVRAGYVGEPGIGLTRTSRETLAEFLVAQVTDPTFVYEAPVVCS